eukprot:3914977-Karenia_brevis.AAC.1
MDAKCDFQFRAEDHGVDWDTANLRVWIDGGSRASEGISASAWLIKVCDEQQQDLRIIAAEAAFSFHPAKSSLA